MFENMYVYNCLCALVSALQTDAGVDEGTGGVISLSAGNGQRETSDSSLIKCELCHTQDPDKDPTDWHKQVSAHLTQ